MPDLITMVERLKKLSDILKEQYKELHNFESKRFWELDQEFKNERMFNELEDEVNK